MWWTAWALAAEPARFLVTSDTVVDGQRMPDRTVYAGATCTGGNRSPALQWTTPPAGTRSLVVWGHDPDAPRPGGWTHWVVMDLPPTLTGLPEGAGSEPRPAGGRSGTTDFGEPRYGGPCPPPGPAHRYVFTVYAVDLPALPVPDGALWPVVEAALQGHIRASAAVMGTWGR
jgi:hypothetical protein